MIRTRIAAAVGLIVLGAAGVATAQEVRPVVFGAVSMANVYRTEDRSFGTELNAGAGAGVEWKRLGVDVEVHRTFGLTPTEISCSVANVRCVGTAREGFLDATMVTANVNWFLTDSRVRPYLSGSVGALMTENVNSRTIVTGTEATLSEFREEDTGLATGIGFGVDVPLTSGLSLRPEFRTYWSVAMSRANLGMHRAAIGVRYRW